MGKNWLDEKVAEIAAYIFILYESATILLLISNESDLKYFFVVCLAFYVLYYPLGDDQEKQRKKHRQSSQIFFACFLFSIATMISARGILYLPVILYHMGNKVLLASATNCCKLLKYLFLSQWCVMLMFLAFFVTTMWMPYEIFCMPRLNLSDNLADFCTKSWPNIHLDAVSKGHYSTDGKMSDSVMLLFAVFICFNALQKNMIGIISLGIFGKEEEKMVTRNVIYEKNEMVPYIWYLVLCFTVYGHQGSWTSILGTCPIFFYAIATIIQGKK